MPARDVLVLGAGLAGLSTAIHLLEADGGRFRVRVLERGHVVGGKASSMPHRDHATGRTFSVDHGLHVVFDYPNLGARLASLGALSKLTAPHHDALLWSDGRVRRFPSLPLPSPLHVVWGGLVSRLYAPLDALEVFRFMVAAFVIEIDRLSAAERRRLDDMSFADFGREYGLSEHVLASPFFRFVAQAAFIYPQPMSALAAIAALQLVAQSHEAVAIRYMDASTSEAIVAPLRERLIALGGTIDIFHRAQRIDVGDGAVTAVQVEHHRHYIHRAEAQSGWLSNYHSVEGDGPDDEEPEPVRADYYVSALPPRDLVATLTPEALALPYFANLTRLRTQRTIALQLWYDRVVSPTDADGAIVGLPGPFSTVCDLRRVQSRPEGNGSVVEFVGEEGAYADRPDSEIVADALAVLHDLWPESRTATIEKRYFHRGRHDDFFLGVPGSDALRPSAASPYPNLVLAGDYTQTGFRVISMEGAWISGMRAADEILAREGLPRLAILPMRQAGGLIPLLRLVRRAIDGLLAVGSRRYRCA